MKNNLSIVVIIIVICYMCQKFIGLPWWTVFIIPLLVLYFSNKSELKAASLGFISIFIFWTTYSWLIDIGNESILSTQIGELFGGIGSFGIIIVTGLIGGIIGSVGGWTGSLLSSVFQKQNLDKS